MEDALIHFTSGIIHDLEAADAPLVVSLGDEALQVLRRIRALDPHPPAETITQLYGDDYGRPGRLTVNGRQVEWLALAHPGLLKGKPKKVDIEPTMRSGPGWNRLHSIWAAQQQEL